MLLYNLFPFILLLFGCFSYFFKFNRLFNIIGLLLPFFILIAFRSYETGADSYGYYHSYNLLQHGSLANVFENSDTEKGFLLLVYCLNLVFPDSPQSLFIVEAVMLCVGLGTLAYKQSNDSFLFLFLSMLTLLNFSLSGVRQTMALSVFFFFYTYICERKIIIYLLGIIMAYYFHKSAILLFPLYFILNRNIDFLSILLNIFVLILCFLSMNFLNTQLVSMLDYEKYSLVSTSGGIITFILSFLYVCFALQNLSLLKSKNKNSQVNMIIIYFSFCALRFVNVMISRFLVYFFFSPSLLIDAVVGKPVTRQNLVFYFLFIILFILTYYYNLNSFGVYKFYFEL